MTSDDLQIACGVCGGPVYMETCAKADHEWAVASECQRCGERVITSGCPDCLSTEVGS